MVYKKICKQFVNNLQMENLLFNCQLCRVHFFIGRQLTEFTQSLKFSRFIINWLFNRLRHWRCAPMPMACLPFLIFFFFLGSLSAKPTKHWFCRLGECCRPNASLMNGNWQTQPSWPLKICSLMQTATSELEAGPSNCFIQMALLQPHTKKWLIFSNRHFKVSIEQVSIEQNTPDFHPRTEVCIT